MADFKSLKKNSSLEKLTRALQNTKQKKFGDDRYWTLSRDKAGNGYALIRFLDEPAVDIDAYGVEASAWVQIWNHAFQGPGGWYIENSLTTLGKPDPVSEENSRIWALGGKVNQDIARERKRKLNYISNILVIKDPAKPECEGKVFLFKYGVKIFEKINDKLDPSPEAKALAAQEGIELEQDNVFSLFTGKNFKLKIQTKDKYPNYDKSEFETEESPVADSDAQIEKIWRSAYSLKAEVAADKFKTYDELKARLDRVLGASAPATKSVGVAKLEESDDTPPFDPDPPKASAPVQRKAKTAEPKKATPAPKEDEADDGDDEMLAIFSKLANE